MRTDKELENNLYHKLELLGVNIDSVAQMNLTLAQREGEKFYRRLKLLMDRYPGLLRQRPLLNRAEPCLYVEAVRIAAVTSEIINFVLQT